MDDEGQDEEQRSSLLDEISRRRVLRVTGAYVVVAWILMQAGEIVLPAFELPNSALRTLILALVAFLPVVVLLAWFLDVSSSGIRWARDIPPDETGAPASGWAGLAGSTEMLVLGIVAPVLGFGAVVGYLVFDDGPTPIEVPAPAPGSAVPSLAVLPFVELAADGDDHGFFALGMHEDVLTQLARSRSLKLISRSSVMPYRETGKSAPEIGRELGVDHILEGTVRRTTDRVRVSARLIRADTSASIWAEQFDAKLADVFAVQSRIARAIARALETELTGDGGRDGSVAVVPAAYDAYLKAREIHRNLDTKDARALDDARLLYETALRLDDRLAAGWLQLGRLHVEAVWFGFDASPGRVEQAQRALDRARELDVEPDQLALAEGIFAYYGESDFGKAALHFDLATELAPSNAEAHFFRGMILRRSGELDSALASQARALELDPLNLGARDEYALTLALAGRLEQARRTLADTLAADANRPRAWLQKWQLDLELDGDPDRLLDEMLDGPRDAWQNQHYSLLESVAVLAGRIEPAREAIRARSGFGATGVHRDYQLAVLARHAGEDEAREALLAQARDRFERIAANARPAIPESEARDVRASFARERRDWDEAIRLYAANVAAQPIERDVLVGAAPLWELASTQLVAGRYAAGVESIERLMRSVALGSVLFAGHYVLEHWPDFSEARSDPALRALLLDRRPAYASTWASTPIRSRAGD